MSDEARRLGRLLRVLAWAQLAAAAAWTLLSATVEPASAGFRVAMIAVVLGVLAATLGLARRGRWRAGAAVMVAGLWLVLAVHVVVLGAVRDASWFLLAILVGEAGLFLGARAAIATIVVSALHGLVVVVLIDRGVLTPGLPSLPILDWAIGVLLFSLIAILQVAGVRLYRGGLEQARWAADRHRALFDGAPLPLWEADLRASWDWLVARDLIGKPAEVLALPAAQADELVGLIQVTDANEAAVRVSGRSREEVLRTGISPANRVAVLPVLEKLAAGERVMQREVELELGGQRRWIVVRAELPADPDRLRRVIVSFLDVTDQRRLAEQLEAAQRLDSLARLAGGIAHDFNNLLTIVRMNADRLPRRLPGAEGSRELERIRDASSRAAALTRQLLLFSRRDVAQPRVVQPDQVIGELEPLLRRTLDPQIELSISAAAEVGAVEIDPGQLEQLILNLALNAADALVDGGTLRIHRGHRTLGAAEADAALAGVAPGRYVSITVADSGGGMSAEAQARAFEPFFTTRPGKRAGLGLSIVHGVVGQAGGVVLLASTPGTGTRVDILLPEVTPLVEPAAVADAAAGGERILLVEDEDGVREVAQAALEDAGYHVVAVRDGDAALVAFGGGDGVDLVVSDLVMPGLGGGELVRRLRSTRPSLPVLCMSGHAADGPPPLDGEARVGFLAKPFTAAQLLASVRAVLPAPTRAAL